MSELRSAVEVLRREVLPDLPDARIADDFSKLQRVGDMIEVERLRRLAELDRRRLFERDGHLSAASWLAKEHNVAWGTAREHLRIARGLEQMPLTRRASRGEEEQRAGRRLHGSVSLLGMVRVDGNLDPETGETLLTALHAVLDAESRSRGQDDTRTPAQGNGAMAPSSGDLGFGIGGSRTELDHTGPVPPDTARRLACDASVMRVVMSGRSEPLDVGRRTPVVSPAIRRAVIARDRHCRFPGCDRPHKWCDAHHVVHLGRRRPHRATRPRPDVPPPPPHGPPTARLPPRTRGRQAGLPTPRRFATRGPSTPRDLGARSGERV